MSNRRATIANNIRDNSIYAITIRTHGYYRGSGGTFHYRRRLQDGRVYTGTVNR